MCFVTWPIKGFMAQTSLDILENLVLIFLILYCIDCLGDGKAVDTVNMNDDNKSLS